MARRPLFDLVNTMLKKAFAKLALHDKPMLRSDEGWRYPMPVYSRLLKEKTVRQNMSRKDNCLDNATMESFFGTLTSEFFCVNRFLNIDECSLASRPTSTITTTIEGS